jgi:UDP-MurNAc hydroxylase
VAETLVERRRAATGDTTATVAGMRVTAIGHAGLHVETRAGSVLCDPWFVPAFHGSWFVFPRNDRLDTTRFTRPDYLYVSHLHGDHFDAPFLQEHVDKGTTVLLPEFPTPELEHALRQLGFEQFVRCPDGEPVDLGGLEVTIFAATAPSDGPIGDSAILLSDGTGRVLNQNDCRPNHPEDIAAGGPIDLHFLQFSGAMWWPVVYDLPADDKARHAMAKREGQMQRAIGYARAIGSRTVVPSAGPPCFVDPDLWELNDFDRSADNIFPDASVFLERLETAGLSGVLAIPGTTFEIDGDRVEVVQPLADDELQRIFTDKRAYLERYRDDWADWLVKEKASWPEAQPDLVGRLAEWWEPLLTSAPHVRRAVGRKLLIKAGDDDVIVDFLEGRVRRWDGDESFQYLLDLPRPLVEWCIAHRAVDWSNSLFLSLRFRAWRPGDYCEELFSFLKSLNADRLAVLERYVAERQSLSPDDDEIVLGDFALPRRCPHKGADLARFGEVEGGILTCSMHGWQWDLDSGRCLNADGHEVQSRPVEP